MGTALGMLNIFISSYFKLGMILYINARNELPWATTNTFFPDFTSFEIFSYHNGDILFTTSIKHSLLGS